jgi:hypothetical protein
VSSAEFSQIITAITTGDLMLSGKDRDMVRFNQKARTEGMEQTNLTPTLQGSPDDTRALQHYLGHKNIQHTVRYTELSPDRFRDFWLPVVGKLVAARMPQHVRMQWERHPGGLAEPLDKMVEADGAHGSAALGEEDVSLVRAFTACVRHESHRPG